MRVTEHASGEHLQERTDLSSIRFREAASLEYEREDHDELGSFTGLMRGLLYGLVGWAILIWAGIFLFA